MSTIITVTGYVTNKGVEELDFKSVAYKFVVKDLLNAGKGEDRTPILVNCTFWGKYHENLTKFVAPYDQITVIGALRKIVNYTPKDSETPITILELNGLHYTLPKRDDADGINKTRGSKQRKETLKPDPAGPGDEEIPF